MKKTAATIWLLGVIVLGVGHADDKSSDQRSEETSNKTIVYAARNAPVAALGETLAAFLKESGGGVVADPTSNVLLIHTGSVNDHERVLAVLQQLDRTPRTIRVQLHLIYSLGHEFTEAEVSSLSGETEGVLKAIETLASAGRAYVANRIELTAVENQITMLQVGKDVPLLTGTTSVPGRGPANNYRSAAVGTMIQVQARLAGESEIVMETNFEKSAIELLDHQNDGSSAIPQGVSKLTHNATSRLRDGHSVLIGTMVSKSKEAADAACMVLSASIDDASETNRPVISRVTSQRPGFVAEGKRTSNQDDSDGVTARYLDFYGKLVAKYDQNNDKMLDADERSKMSKNPTEADTNQDGLVSVEELMTWSRKR
ncbi:MAG: hypothetical protein H6822_07540 [Planctomycetaceae bacterium]|nr:hypothetical protein [Planctomycetales bacterium]MCB9922017.1 hypothetical protein [Planctomycetaceae bacterium]